MLPAGKKKYIAKRLLIAFPVVVLAATELSIFLMIANGVIKVSGWVAVLLVLLLSAIATAALVFMYQRVMTPLRLAKQALNNYVTSQEIPKLPDNTADEAGLLLRNIHATITQLDALNVEKSDMIDLLSHDLRSPVGRILSLSNLVKYDTDTDPTVYADYIENECKGLLRMLENILLMLREDNHVFSMSNNRMDGIVRDTVSFFDFAIAEKKLKMEIDIDKSIYIYVQPDLFTQAVRNILGNAIKFSPEGKTIHISCRRERDNISLTIRDEGMGMKPDDLARIFDRFTKAGKKGTKGEASVGLGLYLSKKIIEKHSGTLMAESKGVNKGASFTIVLHTLITTKKPCRMIDKNLFEPTFLHAAPNKPLQVRPQA